LVILGGLFSPKEITMFEQLFKRRAAVISHHSAPFAAERQFYLQHLLDEGRSRKTLRNIAQLFFAVAHHLRLDGPEITLVAVEAAAAVRVPRGWLASHAWKVP
jgi:hypothetical protein